MHQELKRLVVIGTSMGGLKALREVFNTLPSDLPVAFLVVQHSSEHAKPLLPDLLANCTDLKTKLAEEGEPILPHHVYISRNDKHLVVDDERITYGDGIRINGSRPSIDILFKSCALNYREKVIGIVLTGLLYDGGKGLKTINELGGTTIVQNPEEAEYSDMPKNALKQNEADYITHLEDIGPLLRTLVNTDIVAKTTTAPKLLEDEIQLSLKRLDKNRIGFLDQEYTEDYTEFESLLTILQIMQERTNLYENMAETNFLKGYKSSARINFERSLESKLHTENLRKHLHKLSKNAS